MKRIAAVSPLFILVDCSCVSFWRHPDRPARPEPPIRRQYRVRPAFERASHRHQLSRVRGGIQESGRIYLQTYSALLPRKMVLPSRIELPTSPLPREYSTTELRQRRAGKKTLRGCSEPANAQGPVRASGEARGHCHKHSRAASHCREFSEWNFRPCETFRGGRTTTGPCRGFCEHLSRKTQGGPIRSHRPVFVLRLLLFHAPVLV